MFIHAATDPEAALSALAILLAELHLHADTTQAVTHSTVAAYCLPRSRRETETAQNERICFFFSLFLLRRQKEQRNIGKSNSVTLCYLLLYNNKK